MKIKTVAVFGAGAVGSYVIWGLSRRKDIRLGVLAEGKRAEKLKKGCTINDEVYHPEVWTPQEAKGVDLLICVFEIWSAARCNGQHPPGYRREYHGHESYERRGQ